MTRPLAAQSPGADLRRLVAIVPVRALEGAKSRLGGSLDAEERQDLVRMLLERTIRATAQVPEIESVVVVSPDPAILELAVQGGATPLQQVGEGLNEGLEQAVSWAIAGGASAVLVLAGDLPSVTGVSIGAIVASAAAQLSSSVTSR